MFDDDTLYEVTLPEISFQEFHQHGTLRLPIAGRSYT